MKSRLGLGRRLVGRRDLFQAFAVVSLPLALVLATFIVVQALTLSVGQQSNYEFGRFAGMVTLGSAEKGLTEIPSASLIRRVRRFAPAGRSALVLDSYDLPFDAFPQSVVFYREADWAQHPFGAEYTLLSGRMPRKPGQVAVSAGMFKHPLGRTITAASGDVHLHIVGVIRDRFNTSNSAREVLAAAGTWASFDWVKLRRANFAAVSPQVEVLGDFRDWAQLAIISVRYAASQREGNTSLQPGLSPAFDRTMLADDPLVQSWVVADPLVFKAPALALAVLLPLLLLGLRARRTRRWSGTLRAIGVRPRTASLAVSAGTLALLVVAIVFGVFGGEALGLLVRVLLAPHESQPLSPPASIVGQGLRLAGVMVVVTVAVATVAAEQHRGRSVWQLLARRPSGRMMTGLRWMLVVCAIVALLYVVPGSKPGSSGTLITALVTIVVCLPLVDVFTVARRLSGGRGLRLRLATSRLMMERFQCGAVCAAIVICVGPFIALSVNFAGDQRAQASEWDAWMPTGQIAIRAPNGAKFDRPDPQALRLAEKLTGKRPIAVSSLSPFNLDDPGTGYVVVGSGQHGALYGVDSVAALQQLLPSVLTAADLRIFASGGALVFGSHAQLMGRERLRVADQSRRHHPRALRSGISLVNVASIPNDHGWGSQTAGFMLTSAARRRHLPIHVSQEAFTHITARMQDRIQKAIIKSGAPISSLSVRQPYQYDPEPSGLAFGRYGVLLLLLVTMTAALGSTARSLRKESRSLVAIGVRRSWAWRAVAMQSAIMTVIGLAGGFIVAGVTVWLTTVRKDYIVAVPVASLAVLVAASIAIATTTAALTSIRLRPRRSSS